MEKHQDSQPTRWVLCLLALGCASVAAFSLNAAVVSAEPETHATGTHQFDRQMEPILQSYLKVGDTLAADSLNGVRPEAERIAKLAAKIDSKSVTGEHAAHYKDIPANLKKVAQALSRAKSLDEARNAYKKLSMPMGMWASLAKPKGIDVVYCSMAKASWLQKHGPIRNPYHGSSMLRCGEVVGGAAAHSPV